MPTAARASVPPCPTSRHLARSACRRLALVAAGATTVATLTTLPASTLGAATGSAVRVRVSPAFFGIHDASMLAYGRVRFGSVRLWDAGVTWRDIETRPGHYDWSRLDELVSAAQQHHTRVTLVLAMTPGFYAERPSLPPSDLGHYRSFVRATMLRYRSFDGRRGIAEYQVWNEADVSTFWTGTPYQLAQLTRIVHQVRAAVDPGAVVVAPSFAVRLLGQRRWLSRYLATRVGGHRVWRFFDVTALSLYPMATYGARTGGPEDAVGLLRDVRRRLAAERVPATLPIWATEINYGLPSGAPPGQLAAEPISGSRQAANVIRTYLLAAAAGISRVYWYRYDWGRLPAAQGGGTLGNTLLSDPDDHTRVTAAGRALRTVAHWMSGRLIGTGGRRPCAHDRRGTYTCVVRYRGGTRRILWNPHRRVTVRVAGAVSREAERGRVTRLSGRAPSVKVGYRPVMVLTRR